MKLIKVCGFAALICAQPVYAATSENIGKSTYLPRVTGQFLVGNESQLSGMVDAMFPFIRNNSSIVFADASVMFGDDSVATYSGGLGYRGIKWTNSGPGIFGAFVFTDYYQAEQDTHVIMLNPGLEWLTRSYDARVQAYIPITERSERYGRTMASQIPKNVLDDAGNANSLFGATGHRVTDTQVDLLQEFGPGIEIEGGRFIDYNFGVWVRVGGYYFDYDKAKHIGGGKVSLEFAMNKYASFLLEDSYDNQNHNRVALGIRVNIGGSTAPKHTMESRMTTPILRHIARQSYGQAVPTRKSYEPASPLLNVFDNVWFFSPGGAAPLGAGTTLANCTAENPCATVDSATATQIDSLAPNANLFFETGSYLIPINPINANRWVGLRNNQSVFGRNAGWMTAATDTNRPLVLGGMIWGDVGGGIVANGVLDSMRISNTDQLVPGATLGFLDSVVGAGAVQGSFSVTGSEVIGVDTGANNVITLFTRTNAIITDTTATATGNGGLSVGSVSFNSTSLIRSNISATGSAGNTFGAVILNSGTVEQSHVTATNTVTNATGILNLGPLTFQGNGASTVSASATGVAAPITGGGAINNNSTPKSQCSTNGGPSLDC